MMYLNTGKVVSLKHNWASWKYARHFLYYTIHIGPIDILAVRFSICEKHNTPRLYKQFTGAETPCVCCCGVTASIKSDDLMATP